MKTIEQAALEHAAPIIILQEFNPAQDFIAGVKFAQQWYSGKDDTPEINEKILLVDSSGGTALQIATPYIIDELKRKNGRYAMWRYVELK